jgi:Zn finger protein HypA/HybF involved in hydrogenase expression
MESKKERIIALLGQGYSYKFIVKEVQCSLSTVHFRAAKLGKVSQGVPRYDWSVIQMYHDDGHSGRACARKFGFDYSTWKEAVKRGDIIPHNHVLPMEKLLVADRKKTSRSNLKRRLISEGYLERKCAMCGITEWRGQLLAFDLDHINGVNNDNRLENLRLLCPNCHSQTETHAGKNNLYKKKRLN